MLINMVKAITTCQENQKTAHHLGMDINTDNTPRTEVSKETTSNNCEDNSRDTSVKEMQSMDPFCKCIMKDCSTKQHPNMNWRLLHSQWSPIPDMHQIKLRTFAP